MKIKLVLIVMFIISFFLRSYLLDKNLFFGPEQGIDFLVVRDIVVNHKLTLIGAKTDVGGVFHGPIYYYLSTIPFFISGGNPLFILLFFIALNSLSVFLIYKLASEWFNKRVGLISAILFTFSFGAVVYSRWLSTHPLSIPLVIIFFLFLNSFLKGNKWSLFGVAILFGMVGQSEFLNYLFIGTILLGVIVFFFKRFMKEDLLFTTSSFLLLLVFSVGTYIIFDLRHDFLISRSLLGLLSKSSGYHISFIQSFLLTFKIQSIAFSSFVIPFQNNMGLVLFFGGVLFLISQEKKKNKNLKILLLWVISPFILLMLLKHDVLEQFFVSSSVGYIIMTAFLLERLFIKNKKTAIMVLFLLIGVNMYAWVISIPNSRNIFFQAPQPDLKFSDQKKVIERIYTLADKKNFSFQAYTIPYWTQQGWEYLFWHYGVTKFGYEPIKEKANLLFVIVQDDPSNKNYQNMWLNEKVSKWGKEVDAFKVGILTVRVLSIET